VILVDLYTKTGQRKKADSILEKALQNESKESDFWLQLAELCVRRDMSPTIALEKLQRINRLFEKALSLDPANIEAAEKAADFYFETRQFESAIPLYRQAIAAESEADSDEALALREKLARALMESGYYTQALKVLKQMAVDAPQRIGTPALIGDIHLLEDRLEEAVAAYKEVLRIDPSIMAAALRVADLQMRLGHEEQALATLNEARVRFPGVPLVAYSLAAALSQMQRFPEALPLFKEAERDAKTADAQFLGAPFYFAYGMAAEQAGEIERAATLLQKSIALAPATAAPMQNYLGYMWIERGIRLREAGELIRSALAKDPQNGAYLDSLGWYFYKTGDYAQAIDYLLKAVAALPEPDAVVLEHLGDAYAAAGNPAQALEAWKKALAIDPTNKPLAEKVAKWEKKGKKP